MKSTKARAARQRKRESRNRAKRIQHRNRVKQWPDEPRPMFKSEGARYEFSERSVGLAYGGIAAMHGLMQGLSVPDEINSALHLLKVHVPYWESDHVLSIAYNSLCGGTCLDDLERLRNDEAYVRALGADRIPDPTTSGDFCRRFDAAAVESLQDAFNKTRLRVWQQQPKSFFREAVVDVDGTLVETTGECKEGMDISYDGKWGYQTLLVSFANTREPSTTNTPWL